MSNKRPDQLSGITSLGANDILIAEVNPDSAGTRRVVKITKENLLQGISGGSSSTFTGELLSMSGCTLYASGHQVGINTCDPASGYSLHVSGRTVLSGDAYTGIPDDIPPTLTVLAATGISTPGPTALVVKGSPGSTGVEIRAGEDSDVGLYVDQGTVLGGPTYFGGPDDSPLGYDMWATYFGDPQLETVTIIRSGVKLGEFTTAERDALDSPEEGQMLYNKTNEKFNFRSWDSWITFLESGSNIGDGEGLVSGVVNDDIKVKSLKGGTNVTLSASDDSITINAAGGGGTTSDFAFFSNALNNDGIIEKTYYPTIDPNLYLSGIDVDVANDITLYLRWDGPHDAYMGTGYINGQAIPTGNITQLGTSTRRFEGYISGLDLRGTTIATGVANGFTGTISIQEAGAGPTPSFVHIAPITGATPKAGENLGTTHLKGGDQINVYATFATSDVTGIKVFNSGISDGIDYTAYSLTDTGDGNQTATIPVTVTALRSDTQGVSVVAQNAFGTAGDEISGYNTVELDQVYPVISASDPSVYPGGGSRTDGLRSGESTTFANTISNWSAGVDYILYSGNPSVIQFGYEPYISITNSGVFENPKTVTYSTGIYYNSDNLQINVSRTGNGATDTDNVKIKIANGPVITGIVLSGSGEWYVADAQYNPYGNVIGLSELKCGDQVSYANVYVNPNGVGAGDIDLYAYDSGASQESSWNFWDGYNELADGSIEYYFSPDITCDASRDGDRGIALKARNGYGTESDDFLSTGHWKINNTDVPVVTAGPVAYPVDQSGLKDAESATVTNTVSNADTVEYASPNSDLTISNDTTFEASKTVTRANGNYNVSTNNFTVSGTRAANGMVRGASTVVNIANSAAAFTISNLASSIAVNTGEAVTDDFDLDINQILYEIPSLELDASQSPQSTLSVTASGTGVNENDFQISALATDQKGEFTFGVSGRNLAGKLTTTIGTNPNYTLSGIVFGSGYISELSPCQGLFYLGGPVIGPSTIYMENVSEAAGGPYGGTVYNYQAFSDGFSFDQWCTGNYDNKFAIVTSGAVAPYFTASATGDYLFNLDQTNRQANTSFPGALIVISQPEP